MIRANRMPLIRESAPALLAVDGQVDQRGLGLDPVSAFLERRLSLSTSAWPAVAVDDGRDLSLKAGLPRRAFACLFPRRRGETHRLCIRSSTQSNSELTD